MIIERFSLIFLNFVRYARDYEKGIFETANYAYAIIICDLWASRDIHVRM